MPSTLRKARHTPMSGTPVKTMTGSGIAVAGAALAPTGLGLNLFAIVATTALLIVVGALLVRSARMNKSGRRG
jgi:hypothetical protein